MVDVRRFDVFLVMLDPTIGSELQKTRPCVVVSPDEINRNIATVLVTPMTTGGRRFPSRIPCEFDGKAGFVVLDQLRTVDKSRLVRRLGRMDESTGQDVLHALRAMFAP
jgi:mRNA interferase MazF